jgi:dynactin 1
LFFFKNQLFIRKLTKRLEDLTHDSGALKFHLLPQLKALNNLVPELVNFGISAGIRWLR